MKIVIKMGIISVFDVVSWIVICLWGSIIFFVK